MIGDGAETLAFFVFHGVSREISGFSSDTGACREPRRGLPESGFDTQQNNLGLTSVNSAAD